MRYLWERLRRDYLGELQTMLVIGLAAGAVTAVLNVRDIVSRKPITVTVGGGELTRLDTVAGLRQGVRLDPAELQVVVDHPSTRQLTWHAVQSLPWFVLAMFTLAVLLLVVRAARRDDPFSAANVRRLAAVGWVLTIGSIGAFYLEFVAGFELAATVVTTPPTSSAQLPVVWFFSGFCFLALSEVVKRGRALRTELAGVI